MDLINTLPDHILAQIFGNLGPNMIKTCNLVCKRWDEVIRNSIELMGRFQIVLSDSSDSYYKVNRLMRNYQTATIIRLQGSLNVLDGQKLQTLNIKSLKNIKFPTFIEELNKFPTIKVLVIRFGISGYDVSNKEFLGKVHTEFEELDCPVEIIHIFDCKTIKKMKISWNLPINNKKKKMVIDFLKQQNDVTEMTLYGYFMNEFFTIPEILELEFALTKLKLEKECDERYISHEILIKFLDRHKNSLTSLELHFCAISLFSIKLIHKYVLENLANIKHIEFGHLCQYYAISEDSDNSMNSETPIERNVIYPFDEFLLPTQTTNNIESIVMLLADNQYFYDRFFTLFPNLKRLSFWRIDDSFDVCSSLLTTVNPNLELLNFSNLEGGIHLPNNSVYFQHLKEFSIGKFLDNNTCNFINQHSNTLERIILEDADDISQQITYALLRCVNLKFLELRFYTANTYIVSMLNEIVANIGSLKLKISYMLHERTFILPDDIAVWDEELTILIKLIIGQRRNIRRIVNMSLFGQE